MAGKRYLGLYFAALALGLISPLAGDTYQLILRGKVVMQDGSPPPKSAGIERICSDAYGSAPGPVTDKKGEYLWRMEVDPLKTRTCRIRATLVGYASTEIDISAFNSYTNPNLPPLVLTARGADPNIISVPESEIPGKAQSAWKAAMKAMDAGNLPETTRQMETAVKAAPKFPSGWNALGILYQKREMLPEAKDAFQHAIEQDPKMLPAYLNLSRVSIKMKDWDSASKAADALLKADKRMFPEIYLHQAVARYELKDLAAAEASAQEAIRTDQLHRMPRAEYVLGRILDAKGDASGARDHIMKYVELDPNAPDIAQIRAQLESLGTPAASGADIPLER
jgi:Flp pilus assembly protein TadD